MKTRGTLVLAAALLQAASLAADGLDSLDMRWTFGAHEPFPMYRRVGRHCTGGIDGNAEWVKPWLDWWDAESPKLMKELGLNWLHSRFYKGMGWENEKKDFPNVQKFVRNCHANGVRALAYVQFLTLYPEVMRKEIPEIDSWKQVSADGKPNFYWNNGYFRHMPCICCQEWLDYLKKMCTIALTEGGFDGIMFDNFFAMPCYCARCQRKFREYLQALPDREARFGFDDLSGFYLPVFVAEDEYFRKKEVRDPAVQAWIRWRTQTLTDCLRQLREHIKSVKPDAFVSANCQPFRSFSAAGNLAVDMVDLARNLDIIINQNAYYPKYANGRITSRIRELKMARELKRTIVSLCDSDAMMTPEQEKHYVLPLYEDLVFGGVPTDRTVLSPKAVPGFVDREKFARRKALLEKFNASVAARRAELKAPVYQPVRLFCPYKELQFSVSANRSLAAAEEILTRRQIPWGYMLSLPESPFVVPAGTEVIVVAGQTALSTAQIDGLVAWAKRGGRLVVTGDAGRYSELNAQRLVNPLLPRLEGLSNVVCRAESDEVTPAAIGWTMDVGAPDDHGAALLEDIAATGFRLPFETKGLPETVAADVRRTKGGYAFHFVNYNPSVPVKGASVVLADGTSFAVDAFVEYGSVVAESAAARVQDALVPVAPGDVTVKGSVGAVQDRFFKNRIFSDFAKQEIWKEAHEAFAHPDDDVFNHGIGMWKGEFWGKLMISACRVAAHSKDAALKDFLHREALELVKFQRPDGYLGTYVDPEYVVPLPIAEQEKRIGWPCPWNWNLWCRKYTLWGLLSAYRLTGDRKLLEAADRAMTQQIDMLERRRLKLCDTGTSSMHGFPPCSVLKPLVWLYQETGKRRYLDYASEIVGYFDDPSCQAVQFATKLATGLPLQEWYPAENGKWGKAYEMMSCLAGFVEYYRETGDVRALDVAKGMRERILADELNLCLSVGYNDQFWGAGLRLNGVSEPCDAIHWMRLNHDLYLVTGEAKYADEIERCFYNAFLAAIRPDGVWGARCVRSHGRHQPAPPQSGMRLQHCCVNNMPRGFMDVAETILAKDADGALRVALYHDSEASLGGDRVAIAGNYPVSTEVTVKVERTSAGKVKFRVPAWCPSLTVCGAGLCRRVTESGWTEVDAPAGASEWHLVFDRALRIVRSTRPSVEGYDKKSPLYARWARNSDGDGSEKDLFALLRTTPAAQVMAGPLLLAKSVRLGSSEREILDPETVNGGGWRVSAEPRESSAVWGAWTLTFEKDGVKRTIPVCDYSSAATWGTTGIEFSVFF